MELEVSLISDEMEYRQNVEHEESGLCMGFLSETDFAPWLFSRRLKEV